MRFKPQVYWSFAMFGLSFLYRWILFFHIDHIDYKIEKIVSSNEGQQETQFRFPGDVNSAERGSLVPQYGSSGLTEALSQDHLQQAAHGFDPPTSPPPSYELQMGPVGRDVPLPISLPPYIPPPSPPPGYTTDG